MVMDGVANAQEVDKMLHQPKDEQSGEADGAVLQGGVSVDAQANSLLNDVFEDAVEIDSQPSEYHPAASGDDDEGRLTADQQEYALFVCHVRAVQPIALADTPPVIRDMRDMAKKIHQKFGKLEDERPAFDVLAVDFLEGVDLR